MANITYSRFCLFCKKMFDTTDKHKKFCNLSCSTKNKNKVSKENRIEKYFQNPIRCITCSIVLPYEKRINKFCSKSCGAIYSNSKKDYTKFKSGPKKGSNYVRSNSQHQFTKIRQCIICNKFHPNIGQTCSIECKKKLLSIKIKHRIHNGWNPNSNRGRHKKSYLEISFEKWLKDNYPNINYTTEQPFKRLDEIKTYFADFYFPTLSLIIELDGTQHNNTVEYDQNRDEYIKSVYNINIVRITHTEYKNKTKLELVKNLLEPGSGVKPDTSDWKSDM